MPGIVEKADGSLVLLVHVTLKAGRDDSLIRLVKAAPKKGLASVVREAMRNGTVEDPNELYSEDEKDFEIPEIGFDL